MIKTKDKIVDTKYNRLLHDNRKDLRSVGRKITDIKNFYGLHNDMEAMRIAVHRLWIYIQNRDKKKEYEG